MEEIFKQKYDFAVKLHNQAKLKLQPNLAIIMAFNSHTLKFIQELENISDVDLDDKNHQLIINDIYSEIKSMINLTSEVASKYKSEAKDIDAFLSNMNLISQEINNIQLEMENINKTDNYTLAKLLAQNSIQTQLFIYIHLLQSELENVKGFDLNEDILSKIQEVEKNYQRLHMLIQKTTNDTE